MIYRVVKKSDGLYYLQYRTLFFWWSDSCAEPLAEREDAIEKAKRFSQPRPNRARVLERVWP